MFGPGQILNKNPLIFIIKAKEIFATQVLNYCRVTTTKNYPEFAA